MGKKVLEQLNINRTTKGKRKVWNLNPYIIKK